MNNSNSIPSDNCAVCGGSVTSKLKQSVVFHCNFCGFEKIIGIKSTSSSNDLIYVNDVNEFFKNKYVKLNKGETFQFSVPVTRFYKRPKPIKGQINFFKSKNIMFLIEQHGFQMVSRESRFSTQLTLLVRKV